MKYFIFLFMSLSIYAQNKNLIIRVSLEEFANDYAERVEFCADQIIDRTKDVEIRERAFLWKLNTIPAIRYCAFRKNVYDAVYYTYAYTKQLEYFFKEGNGKESFGEYQEEVLATVAILSLQVEMIELELMGHRNDLPKKFYENNQFEDFTFTRSSVIWGYRQQATKRASTLGTITTVADETRLLLGELRLSSKQILKEATCYSQKFYEDLELNKLQGQTQVVLDQLPNRLERIDSHANNLTRYLKEQSDKLDMSLRDEMKRSREKVDELLLKAKGMGDELAEKQRIKMFEEGKRFREETLVAAEKSLLNTVEAILWRLFVFIIIVMVCFFGLRRLGDK